MVVGGCGSCWFSYGFSYVMVGMAGGVLLFFVVAVDFVLAFGLLGEEQGWLSCFHVFKRDVVIAHGHSDSHGGLGDVGTFYIKCHRKMYQH